MKLVEMTAIVKEEIKHIPKGDYDFQGQLRSSYHFWRMNSLGKRAEGPRTRGEVMRKCVEGIRQPDDTLEYDRDYFT
ncbi:MAG: hypothetical protein ACJ8C4_07190 [Gemmataceae bacterium]